MTAPASAPPRQRYYDAMNGNATKLDLALHDNPASAPFLVREQAKCRMWLQAHARAEQQLRL